MRATTIARVVALLPFCAQLGLAIDPARKPHQPTGNGDRLLSYNDTTPSAKIRPSMISVRWSGMGDDGQYITTNEKSDLVLVDIASGKETLFLSAHKQPNKTQDFWIRHDGQAILAASNATKKYRHSYFSNYFIVHVKTGNNDPLVKDQAGDIQFAVMAPTGKSIAFVRGNNVFLRDADGKIDQITTNGSPDLFNGVPDWVYEEEVLGDRFALWYSPDAKYVAFLSFNETGVQKFTIPYFMAGQKVAPAYPKELALRYPKVGTTNPTVALNILNVETKKVANVPLDAFAQDDTIIGEVKWVTDGHSALIYRAFNRVQDQDKHVVVDPETLASKIVRNRDGRDGWLENSLAIVYVGCMQSGSKETYYVDLSDESGWMHIYLHSVDGGKPVQLTSGEWEVDSILYVDAVRQLIYFKSTTRHSTERHIYSVSYTTKTIRPLVDDQTPAVWDASFSAKGGYYILSYAGPDVPYQELYTANNTATPIRTVTSNAELYEKIKVYNLPNITYFELKHPDGFTLNVMQQLPPHFDPSKKYPSLFTPYGGPNSQKVKKEFQPYAWKAYISSEPELQYVVYTIDNRGTGFKGRKFRSSITRHLGDLEAKDQIWAAQQLIQQNPFLDSQKVGIWGWSYGGYLTAKVIEADSGVFTLGLSTAPVSDWRFYDSVYTERYMKTLTANPGGYERAAVRDVAGFRNIRGVFALMHGTGDDNVHYQNAAALADVLVAGGVSPDKFRMMVFTDSDHGIRFHGASAFVYKFLTGRLWEEVRRREDKLVHQWSRRRVGV